jgi:hypothetical protein
LLQAQEDVVGLAGVAARVAGLERKGVGPKSIKAAHERVAGSSEQRFVPSSVSVPFLPDNKTHYIYE